MTGAELSRLAADLGVDVVGAASAQPYEETERHIRERRSRGLFADMRFTMARPEVSCHPELLLEGARSVVAAALCYFAPGPEPSTDEGRLPRYTWRDEYSMLRERLEELGTRLGGAYRVLVDDNDHVDREAAVRAGIAFYGKNTMAITRQYGSWVVLGALVTDVEIEPSPALELNCGSCRLCIDACPTGALDEPGVLDATKCLSYWTQAPAPVPEPYRAELGQTEVCTVVLADVAAHGPIDLDAEFHAARHNADLAGRDLQHAKLGAHREHTLLWRDEQLAVGIVEKSIDHRRVGRIEVHRRSKLLRGVAVAADRDEPRDEIGFFLRDRQRSPAQLVRRCGHLVERCAADES